jgi:hypothetical protein
MKVILYPQLTTTLISHPPLRAYDALIHVQTFYSDSHAKSFYNAWGRGRYPHVSTNMFLCDVEPNHKPILKGYVLAIKNVIASSERA